MMEYQIIKKGRKGFLRPIPSFQLSKKLESSLSYMKKGAEFFPHPMWAKVKLYNIKSASFPYGLLDDVINLLREDNHSIKVLSLRKDKPVIIFSPFSRNYQREAIRRLVENNGGILSMPTGSGKTFTCIDYLKQHQKPSLVIVPTLELVKQWKKQSPDYVHIRTYQGIKDYSILNEYDIVTFDEVHHVSASTIYKIAMHLNEQIVVGLSGTVNLREDGEDMKVSGAIGKVVYSVSTRELINQGYLSDAEIELIELTPYHSEGYKTYQEIYKEYIIENKERNDKIISLCKGYKDKKILVLVGQIEHGQNITNSLNGEDCVFIWSKIKVKDTNHRIIVASSVFDEGVDIPDCDIIIMAAGGQSSIKCIQRIGRVLRTSPNKEKALIIDFIDNAKYLFQHYKKRKRIYEEHGFRIRGVRNGI